MRIALFSEVFLPKIDGITARLSQALPELLRQGHEVTVFAPGKASQEAACELPGVRMIRVPSLPLPLQGGLEAALPDPRIVSELFALRPDVVHVVGPVCLGAWGALAARALGLPLVASFQTGLARYLAGGRLASLGGGRGHTPRSLPHPLPQRLGERGGRAQGCSGRG